MSRMSLTVFIENFTTSTQSSTTAYDWWKDIIIPLIGAIAIPLLIWWLSWLFGASRAERQKELKELRDNLNLLLSVLYASIQPLIDLKQRFLKLQNIISLSPVEVLTKHSHELGECNYFRLSLLDTINASKYSSCIELDDNYVVDLLVIIQRSYIITELVQHRNKILQDIGCCENQEAKLLRVTNLIAEDKMNVRRNIMHINDLLLRTEELIEKTSSLPKKKKKLKLDSVYLEHFSVEFKTAKQELDEYNKMIKDKTND